MSSTTEKVVDAIIVFAATALAHVFLGVALLSALSIFGDPVGAHKLEAFGLFVVPIVLFVVGWAQGSIPFFINICAGTFVWLERWRFGASYDPALHVGTLMKEQPIDVFTAAFAVFVLCSLISAAWNASLRIRGKDIVLNIPFKGQKIIWREGNGQPA